LWINHCGIFGVVNFNNIIMQSFPTITDSKQSFQHKKPAPAPIFLTGQNCAQYSASTPGEIVVPSFLLLIFLIASVFVCPVFPVYADQSQTFVWVGDAQGTDNHDQVNYPAHRAGHQNH